MSALRERLAESRALGEDAERERRSVEERRVTEEEERQKTVLRLSSEAEELRVKVRKGGPLCGGVHISNRA